MLWATAQQILGIVVLPDKVVSFPDALRAAAKAIGLIGGGSVHCRLALHTLILSKTAVTAGDTKLLIVSPIASTHAGAQRPTAWHVWHELKEALVIPRDACSASTTHTTVRSIRYPRAAIRDLGAVDYVLPRPTQLSAPQSIARTPTP